MKIEKIFESVEKIIKELNVSPENLISAIIRLLEMAHNNGLDEESRLALSNCGITLEIEEV